MSQRDVTGWLPNLLGPTDFQVNAAPQSVPKRSTINLIGGIVVADNQANDSTDITFTVSGGLEVVDITAHGGAGDGTTDNTAAMTASIALLATNGAVYFPPGIYAFSSTQAWNCSIWLAHGAVIKPASTRTITIGGAVDANTHQKIFDLSSGGKVAFGVPVTVYPEWWGAVADGATTATDNAPFFKAAIDSIPAITTPSFYGGKVQLGSGYYVVKSPLYLNKGGLKFVGAGYECTTIISEGFSGPILNVAPVYDPVPTVSGILGTGVSLKMDPTAPPYQLNLRDAAFMGLDGLAAFTVEFFINIDPSTLDGSPILQSLGTIKSGLSGTSAFAFNLFQSSSQYTLVVGLNTSAGGAGGACPTKLNTNTLYHIALVYDGTNAKWYINGAVDLTIAKSGTVAQAFHEDICAGWSSSSWSQRDQIAPFAGAMDSIRFSNSVIYASNFTPPSTKLSKTDNTILLVNFDTTDMFNTVGTCADLVGNPADTLSCYLPRRAGGELTFISNISGCHVGDMTVHCGFRAIPMYCANCQDSIFENTHAHAATNGFNWYFNCTQLTVKKLNIDTCGVNYSSSLNTKGQYGYSFNVCGLTSFDDCVTSSGIVGVLTNETSLYIKNYSFFSNAPAQYGIMAYGTPLVIEGYNIDNENAGEVWQAGLFIDTCFTVVLIGGEIDLALDPNPAACVELSYGGSPNKQTNNFVAIGTQFNPSVGGQIFKFTGTPVAPTNCIGCTQGGSNAPAAWGDANGQPNLDGVVVRPITSGTSSTAYHWDRFIPINVSTAYNLTTEANPDPGQPLVVKDQSGHASTNNITITANAGQTIDGGPTLVISADRGKAALCFDGISDWMS